MSTGAQAAAPASMPAPPVAVAPRRKTSPIVYILIGLVALIVLVVGAVAVGGVYVVHKARQAGLDPTLWEKNPSVAVARFLAATNPDAEIVSVDDGSGMVTIRNKRDGKVVKFSVNDLKQGRFTWEADGQKTSLTADGNGVNIRTADGTTSISSGASLKLPAWLPAYAGAKDPGGLINNGPKGESGVYGFKTSDAPAKVLEYYSSALKNGGFTVDEKAELGTLTTMSAENDKSTVQMSVTSEGGQTGVSITFEPKE